MDLIDIITMDYNNGSRGNVESIRGKNRTLEQQRSYYTEMLLFRIGNSYGLITVLDSSKCPRTIGFLRKVSTCIQVDKY